MQEFRTYELGRKPGADAKHVNLRLSPVEVKRLDAITERTQLSKSDVLRALLNRYAIEKEGVEDV